MPVTSDLVSVALGLTSAASWGAGDFSGGLATRRTSVYGVVIVAHAVGLVILIGLALLHAEPIIAVTDLLWGSIASLTGIIGLVALYRALATGRMGLVAPVSAVLTASLPVLFGMLTQGLPSVLQMSGFALAVVGVWFVSRSTQVAEAANQRESLILAAVAGLGFGSFLILIARVNPGAVFWPLAAARATSCVAMLILATVTRQKWQPERSRLPLIIGGGVLDLGGNLFFLLAAQAGRLDVASILSSLYPASTVILARLILKEHISRTQGFGIGVVLIAIALIAS